MKIMDQIIQSVSHINFAIQESRDPQNKQMMENWPDYIITIFDQFQYYTHTRYRGNKEVLNGASKERQ